MPYTKNIAVIRGLKDGFSADGGALSGLVKAEQYASHLKVEVSYINFAPLSEGRYICGISDGKQVITVENGLYEGNADVSTESGFAAVIFYVNGGVFPIASAICGNYHDAVFLIKGEIEKRENTKPQKKISTENAVYEDEAIAEDNYYEYETNESQGILCADKDEEKTGRKSFKDETAFSAFAAQQDGLKDEKGKLPPEYAENNGETAKEIPLSRGDFFKRMKGEIEGIFQAYPPEEKLEKLIEGSKWAKISYGDGKYYVFGVLYAENKAEYICYGVPTPQNEVPPDSMQGLASFLPADGRSDGEGYWVIYQDAETGAPLKLENI